VKRQIVSLFRSILPGPLASEARGLVFAKTLADMDIGFATLF
jgi:hypothetical protein